MDLSPKFFLSIIILFLLLSCDKSDIGTSNKDRIKESQEYLEMGEGKFYQGTPKNVYYIKKAIELDSMNAAAWRELSVPYLKRGIPHEWKPLFDRAVEIDPVGWQGWRGYLKLFFYRDYESAIKDLDATDSLTPNFTDYPQGMSVDYLRALAYLGLKDYKTSLQFLNKYINEVTLKEGEKWVDVNAFLYRGIVFHYLNQDDNARKDFLTHIAYYEHSSDGYYRLACLDFKDGNYLDAKTNITMAKELFNKGYYLSVPYVEAFCQIYLIDIEEQEARIDNAIKK